MHPMDDAPDSQLRTEIDERFFQSLFRSTDEDQFLHMIFKLFEGFSPSKNCRSAALVEPTNFERKG